jgi:Zn-dependent protease
MPRKDPARQPEEITTWKRKGCCNYLVIIPRKVVFLFLALMQISALVLNLIPMPPFDGYSTLAPYLDRQLRFNIDQYSNVIMLVHFEDLWYVPFVNDIFWTVVFQISPWLQIPLMMAVQCLNLYMLWRQGGGEDIKHEGNNEDEGKNFHQATM